MEKTESTVLLSVQKHGLVENMVGRDEDSQDDIEKPTPLVFPIK